MGRRDINPSFDEVHPRETWHIIAHHIYVVGDVQVQLDGFIHDDHILSRLFETILFILGSLAIGQLITETYARARVALIWLRAEKSTITDVSWGSWCTHHWSKVVANILYNCILNVCHMTCRLIWNDAFISLCWSIITCLIASNTSTCLPCYFVIFVSKTNELIQPCISIKHKTIRRYTCSKQSKDIFWYTCLMLYFPNALTNFSNTSQTFLCAQ